MAKDSNGDKIAPQSKTAKIPKVNGTVVKGRGKEIWEHTAITAAKTPIYASCLTFMRNPLYVVIRELYHNKPDTSTYILRLS